VPKQRNVVMILGHRLVNRQRIQTGNSKPISCSLLEPVFFEDTVQDTDTPPLSHECLHAFFQQDCATAPAVWASMNVLRDVIGYRFMGDGLWTALSPNLNTCHFCFWGSIWQTVDELNVRKEVFFTSQEKLQSVNVNFSQMCQQGMHNNGKHFQCLLLTL
jgi:hypothetical protein